jgi:peptidoglycan/LPS O-acetylase OafA/YrhL
MQYRPEIEGLRALSVMLVILHHLGVPFVSGGYVGVDIFFVISGYLITHTLISESQQGKFSIGGFYKKRIIRLAPAYFAVVTIVTVVSAVLLLPSELTAYAKSALASTFFLANIFMWKETDGYFGESAETIPLLHLWSLAVEEQFYIFWPIIILILSSFIRSKHYIILVLSIVVLGVIASEWATHNTPVAAYFLMPTRAFELLIGAALIFLPVIPTNSGLKNIASLLGIGLIFLSAIILVKKPIFQA